MVNDAEARDAVRQLITRLDTIAEQGVSLAYVLAKRDMQEYTRLLKSAERAARIVIRPLADFDDDHKQALAALDDPSSDWPKAVLAMLNQGPIVWSGELAAERLKFVQDLESRFEAEDRNKNTSDGEGEPIGD